MPQENEHEVEKIQAMIEESLNVEFGPPRFADQPRVSSCQCGGDCSCQSKEPTALDRDRQAFDTEFRDLLECHEDLTAQVDKIEQELVRIEREMIRVAVSRSRL